MQADEESRGGAVRQAFDRFDSDRSGTLTKDECVELIAASGFSVTREYLEGVWTVYDRNEDGVLDFEEFSTFYKVLANRSEAQSEQTPSGDANGREAIRFGAEMQADEMQAAQPCRVALLLLLLVLLVVFVVVALVADPAEVHLCDQFGPGGPVQCEGPDDDESCEVAGLVNATCVRSSCGFRLLPKIDVSVVGSADPLSPAEPTDAAHVLMIISSVVPYALVVCILACQISAADTFTLLLLGLLAVLVVLNEAVLKRLIEQRRPTGSCLHFASFGMPSGHASTSIGTLTFLLLETWIDRPTFSVQRKGATTAALLLLLAPVPYSRVHLYDHTPAQVAAGATEGFCVATLWFLCVYRFVRPRLEEWAASEWGARLGLRNTYRTERAWMPEWWRGAGDERASATSSPRLAAPSRAENPLAAEDR